MIRAGATLLLLLGPGAAFAQSDIVVTGHGLGEAQGDAVYDVVAIGRERLVNSASGRLEDVLRDVPGFLQFRRSDARSANPTSQGATLRSLGGNASGRALVLLDGVPQTDPFGGWIAWPALDPRRLAAVRVVRGGGSGVNGPGALAGTIELESLAAEESEGPAGGLSHGSRDSVDAFASYGARLGGGFGGVSAAFARGDGFIPVVAAQRGPIDRPSPYRQASLALRAAAPLSTGVELQANLSGFIDRRERGTPLSGIDSEGADASLRLVGRGRLPFSALAYLQLRDFSNLFVSVGPGRAGVSQTLDQHSVPSTGLGARVELRPRLGPGELRLGADWRETQGHSRELFQFAGGAPTRGRSAGGRTRTLGAFTEAAIESGPFTLSGGARIDHWRIEDGRLSERLLASGAILNETDFPDRSGWQPTARGGLAWRASPALRLRTAAYLGWRLPTLNELYRPFRIGADATAANAALAPERLRGIEAGAELSPARGVRLSATLFANRLDDAIANVTLGQGPGVFPGVGFVGTGGQYRMRGNVEAIVSRGVELELSARFGPFRLAAGYAFAAAEVRARGPALALDGLRPAQTPRHGASASLSWGSEGGAYASLSARYVSSQYEDDLNERLLPDALTFDAVALVPLTQRLAIEARAENIGNALVVAGISGAGIVERATPRTFWLGLSWRR